MPLSENQTDPANNTPAPSGRSDSDRTDGGTRINNNTLNYYGNDIDALRRLAQVCPKLAEKIIDQKDKEDEREHASYRFGLVCSVGLVGAIVWTLCYALVNGGVIAAIILVSLTLALALLVRVVLTGEWSDTSWFGLLVSKITELLGSVRRNGSDDANRNNGDDTKGA